MIRSITRWWVLGFTVCVVPASLAYGQASRGFQMQPVSLVAAVPQGELRGIIRDQRGGALIGAMVSASARGSSPLFAISDREGRYVFRNLAPGAYFVRAYLDGYASPRGGFVQVSAGASRAWPIALNRLEPEVPPIFTAGVGAIGTSGSAPALPRRAPDDDEVAWRMRQLKRGVLKEATAAAIERDLDRVTEPASVWRQSIDPRGGFVSLLDSVDGQINLLTTTSFDRPQDLFEPTAIAPRPIAYVSLVAPLSGGDWAVRGSITEGDIASWILAGSFTRHREDSAHQYEIGLTYAAQRYQGGNVDALAAMRGDSRNVGEIYAEDSWAVTSLLTIAAGGRYASYDYLADRVLLGGRMSIAYQVSPTRPLRFRVTAAHRELAPGAEEFVAPTSGVWLPPERTFSALTRTSELRPEKVDIVELAAEHPVRGGVVIGLRAFRQQIDDQLVTVFGRQVAGNRVATPGHYRVGTAGDFENYGWGATVARNVGSTQATIDYTMTDTHRRDTATDRLALWFIAPGTLRREERVHDLTASVRSRVAATATGFLVVYKLNNAYATSDSRRPETAGRFAVEVTQEMPFLDITGARWEMLVAVRDLFRSEMFEGSVYDELFVVTPPKRVTAGVKVRF